MGLLLGGKAFDDFRFLEGTLVMEAAYHFDGTLHPEYYTETELAELSLAGETRLPWRLMKERIFGLIRGNHTPISFSFSLLLSPESTADLTADPDVTGLVLNIRFREKSIFLTTGVSRTGFSIDRSADLALEEFMRHFLKKSGIAFEKNV